MLGWNPLCVCLSPGEIIRALSRIPFQPFVALSLLCGLLRARSMQGTGSGAHRWVIHMQGVSWFIFLRLRHVLSSPDAAHYASRAHGAGHPRSVWIGGEQGWGRAARGAISRSQMGYCLSLLLFCLLFPRLFSLPFGFLPHLGALRKVWREHGRC